MIIAFITGRTGALAHKEIEAAATILPFQWSTSILPSGTLLLKPDGPFLETEGDLLALINNSSSLIQRLGELQKRLGGTVKTALLFDEAGTANLNASLLSWLRPWQARAGRLEIGLSAYGRGVEPGRLGIHLKGLLKKDGPCRVVTPQEGGVLSSVQVLHNKLVGKWEQGRGEIVLIQDGGRWRVGLTVAAQDPADYRLRDYSIPAPDPVSGMLPPKLAQILANLALRGETPATAVLYDPFCGNGRLVNEARLLGFSAYGSDLEATKVAASQENWQWYVDHYDLPAESDIFWQHDATAPDAASVAIRRIGRGHRLVIACEPYLGKPLRQPLAASQAEAWAKELQGLYLGFLKGWSPALGRLPVVPQRMILVVPRVKRQGGLPELSLYPYLVDRLAEFGYSSIQLSDYGRPDAVVSREVIEISFTR